VQAGPHKILPRQAYDCCDCLGFEENEAPSLKFEVETWNVFQTWALRHCSLVIITYYYIFHNYFILYLHLISSYILSLYYPLYFHRDGPGEALLLGPPLRLRTVAPQDVCGIQKRGETW